MQKSAEITHASRFDIQRLYVKEHFCKIPNAPAIFREEWKPDIQLEMNVKHEKTLAAVYEMVLHLNLSAKLQQRTAFLIRSTASGCFRVRVYYQRTTESFIKGEGVYLYRAVD